MEATFYRFSELNFIKKGKKKQSEIKKFPIFILLESTLLIFNLHVSDSTVKSQEESLFTLTAGVLLYTIFGVCFLVTNLAYVSGIYTVHMATAIPGVSKFLQQ